jgi:CcmD family protein
MDTPANTLNYMIAGYSVIFAVIIIYLVSLRLRWRRARKEMELLEIAQRFETETKTNGKP